MVAGTMPRPLKIPPGAVAAIHARGDIVPFIAAADHKAGDVLAVSGYTGVVTDNVLTGKLGEAIIEGIAIFPAAASFTPGDKVDWNGTIIVAGAGGQVAGTVLYIDNVNGPGGAPNAAVKLNSVPPA